MTIETLTVILALLLSLFNLWDKIESRYKAAKAPTKHLEERLDKLERQNEKYDLQRLDERLTKLEKQTEKYDTQFARDLRRLDAIEEGNRVVQRALLALLKHAINGNDVEECEKASKALDEYLIQR